MKKRLWFKRRRYGYGFIPVTREGYVLMTAYLLTIIVGGVALLKDVPEDTYQAEVGYYVLLVFVVTLLTLLITYSRSPKPKWRWGTKETDDPELDF